VTAFLLDTHTFIWLSENDPALPPPLKASIDTAETVYISIASLWEIAIKVQLGKLILKRPHETIGPEIDASDILLLPISFADTVNLMRIL
jgi:PIN domain nuclease of toxin-antitoxin system